MAKVFVCVRESKLRGLPCMSNLKDPGDALVQLLRDVSVGNLVTWDES